MLARGSSTDCIDAPQAIFGRQRLCYDNQNPGSRQAADGRGFRSRSTICAHQPSTHIVLTATVSGAPYARLCSTRDGPGDEACERSRPIERRSVRRAAVNRLRHTRVSIEPDEVSAERQRSAADLSSTGLFQVGAPSFDKSGIRPIIGAVSQARHSNHRKEASNMAQMQTVEVVAVRVDLARHPWLEWGPVA